MTAESAVVTGAGRGIGRAIALGLAQRGLSLTLLARTTSELEETARQVVATGADVRAEILACDLADADAVDAACALVQRRLGTPRVVVNNAGIVRRGRLEAMSLAEWDEVLDVNLRGAFLVTRGFLPAMRAAGTGRIVNIASISATLGTAEQTAYNAAKWGLVGLTKSLAEELRGSGLQTLVVLPGAVDTDMLKGSPFAPQMSSSDVARTVVYASLDAPDAMNGSALEIFGP